MAFDLGYEVYGIDVQPRMVNIASQRLPNAKFQVLDMQVEALPRPFDVVTAFEVIEHLERPLESVSSMRDVLKPGGYLVLSVSSAERRPFFKRLRVSDFAPHHLTMWTQEALALLLGAAGLAVIRMVKKGFDLNDFLILAEDAFSLRSRPAKRLAGSICWMLEPALRLWPDAGGCTIFAVASRTSVTPMSSA